MIERFLSLVALLMTSLAMSAQLADATIANSDAPTVLVYSDHEPYGNMRTTFLQEVFFKEVERESHGRIRIEPHWGGEISTSYKALEALQQKKTDLTTFVPEYDAKALPLHQLFKSFMVGPSGAEQVAKIQQIYREIPELTEEYNRQNATPVFISTGYPVAFFSTQKLKSLKDIKGQTWRTASFWHVSFLKNAGANTIRTPWGDAVIQKFNDGTLQGLMVNIDSAFDINVDEYTKYALVSPEFWLGHIYPVVMNTDTWNRLSAEDKQAFAKAAKTSYGLLGGVMDKSFSELLEVAKSRNVEVRVLSPKEVRKWAKMTRYHEVQQEWAAKQSEEGLANVEKVFAKMKDILE